MIGRRSLLGGSAAIGTAAALPTPAAIAQDAYPSRPVRVVVPFAAGGGADAVGRAIADRLSESLGRPFVVDNRPGAAGNIGTEQVARAAPDGYTLLVVGPNHATNAHLFRQLPFDPVRDFAPISLLTSAPYVLVANPDLPARNFQDLLALARARPGALSYGSAGNGTAGHLAMELIKSMTGIDIVHVPYRGSPPLLADLVSGQVVVGFDNVLSSAPLIASGRLRPLAVSAARRAPALPEVAPIAEQGLPGFDVTVWQGLLAPAGTPQPIIARLHAAIRDALGAPTLRERLAALGVEAIGSTPEEFARFLAADLARWGEAVRRSGARLD